MLLNEVKKVGVVKINQMPRSSNDTMKNEPKQVNVTMDVLEQAEKRNKDVGVSGVDKNTPENSNNPILL